MNKNIYSGVLRIINPPQGHCLFLLYFVSYLCVLALSTVSSLRVPLNLEIKYTNTKREIKITTLKT